MSSASADRSISGGMSLPQWMKTKISDRYDLEQATFSPPSEDDSFFFIPYSRSADKPVVEKPVADKPVEIKKPDVSPPNMTDGGSLKRSATDTSPTGLSSLGGRLFGHYFNTVDDTPATPPPAHQLLRRRDSKSLPASPLSSPHARRKNPYFADPFFGVREGGWLTAMVQQRTSVDDLSRSGDESSKSELREMNFWSPVTM